MESNVFWEETCTQLQWKASSTVRPRWPYSTRKDYPRQTQGYKAWHGGSDYTRTQTDTELVSQAVGNLRGSFVTPESDVSIPEYVRPISDWLVWPDWLPLFTDNGPKLSEPFIFKADKLCVTFSALQTCDMSDFFFWPFLVGKIFSPSCVRPVQAVQIMPHAAIRKKKIPWLFHCPNRHICLDLDSPSKDCRRPATCSKANLLSSFFLIPSQAEHFCSLRLFIWTQIHDYNVTDSAERSSLDNSR